jgi:hypothetical protein
MNSRSVQTDDQKKTNSLKKVVSALERVNPETNQMILDMAKGMTEAEIIAQFNQMALDFFNSMISITKKLGSAMEREYGAEAYLIFFKNAIKVNAKLPIDQFTLTVLEFAPEIYREDEDCFLNMDIPDGKLDTNYGNNEFSLIRSEKFKKLWKILSATDKETVKKLIIYLTTYAHTFFMFSLLQRK